MSREQTQSRSSADGYRFSTPEKLSVDYWKFDRRDRYWLGTMLAVTLIVAQLHPLFFVAGVVVTLLSLLRTSNARLYEVLIRNTRKLTVTRLHGGKIVAEDHKKSQRLMPYDEIVTVSNPKTNAQIMSMLRLERGSYGVLIVGDGAATPMLGRWQQAIRTAVLGRQLRQMVNLGVSWVMQIRPWNVQPFDQFKANALHERAYMPKSPIDPDTSEDNELATYGRFLHDYLIAQEKAFHKKAREVVMAVPLIMAGNTALESSSGEIGVTELKRSPIVSRAHQVVKYLKRYGVVRPRIATEQELVAYLRQTWDCVGLAGNNGYYKRTHDGLGGLARFKDYLPKNITYHPKCLEVDGNFIAFLRARSLPPSVEPGWLADVFSVLNEDGMPINMTTATLGSVVNKKGEVRSLNVFIPLRKLIESKYLSPQFRSSDNIASHRQALEREQELSANQKRMQDFLFLQLVFGSSIEELEADVDCVSNAMEAKDMDPYQVTDPDSMWDCLWVSNGFGQM